MPTSTASKSTAAKPARKTRTRKPATPKARTRKAVAKPEPAKVVITPDSESVKRSYQKIEDAKVNDGLLSHFTHCVHVLEILIDVLARSTRIVHVSFEVSEVERESRYGCLIRE